MTKKYLGLAAGLLFLAGCSNNDFIDNGANVPAGQVRTISSIHASLDQADTRLVLGKKQLIWEGQEHAFVFSDTETVGVHDYEMSYLDTKLNTADFSGDEISGTEFYAFIPSPNAVDFSAKEATLRWGYDVIYDQVNINRNIPMFAKSTNAQMQFKQLAGILHFKIYGKGILLSLTLSGNNGEKFYQNYKLNYAANEINLMPASVSEEEPTSIVEAIAASTDGKCQYLEENKPFDVYFVLPAGMTFEKGFTLSGMTEIEDLETAAHSFVPFEKTFSKSFTVTRAEMSSFAAFSTTGEVIEPSDNLWTLSLNNKSGAYAEVSYNFPPSDSGVVNWIVNFYDAENSANQTCMVHMSFPGLPHTGGTPSLDMLDGMRFSGDDFHAALYDYSGKEEVDYNISDTKVHFDKDGDIWHIYFESGTAKVSGESTIIEGIDFDYTGTLEVSYQSLIDDKGEVVTYLIPNGDVNYSSDWGSWHFNLYDEHGEYNVSFLMSSDGFTNPQVIPTGTFTVDLYVDDMENKYRNSSAPVTIEKNSDGIYTISFSHIRIGDDGSPELNDVSMTWTGYLDNPDELKTGEWEWYYAPDGGTTLTGAYGYKGIDIVRGVSMEDGGGVHYKLIFTDYDMSKGMPKTYNEVSITWTEPFADFVPSFPKNRMVTGYIIHVNQGGGYDHEYQGTNTSEAELTISTAYDGTVTISAPTLMMSPGYGQEGHASTFSFTGKLNDMGVTDN